MLSSFRLMPRNALFIWIILILCTGCQIKCDSKGKVQWGTTNNGLRTHVDVNTETNSEHAVVELSFQNVSENYIRIWQSGFWLNTTIQCWDNLGNPAKPTHEGEMLLKLFSPGGDRSKNVLVALSPGQIYRVQPVELESIYQITRPGEYKIRAIYEENLGTEWSGAVTSNIVNVHLAEHGPIQRTWF